MQQSNQVKSDQFLKCLVLSQDKSLLSYQSATNLNQQSVQPRQNFGQQKQQRLQVKGSFDRLSYDDWRALDKHSKENRDPSLGTHTRVRFASFEEEMICRSQSNDQFERKIKKAKTVQVRTGNLRKRKTTQLPSYRCLGQLLSIGDKSNCKKKVKLNPKNLGQISNVEHQIKIPSPEKLSQVRKDFMKEHPRIHKKHKTTRQKGMMSVITEENTVTTDMSISLSCLSEVKEHEDNFQSEADETWPELALQFHKFPMNQNQVPHPTYRDLATVPVEGYSKVGLPSLRVPLTDAQQRRQVEIFSLLPEVELYGSENQAKMACLVVQSIKELRKTQEAAVQLIEKRSEETGKQLGKIHSLIEQAISLKQRDTQT